MKFSFQQATVLVVAGVFLFLPTLWADSVDGTDVALLRLTTTNLDGRGICVAQVEDSVDDDTNKWMVSPANVGQPASLFTFASALGSANTYPNEVGTNSWHADFVGQLFYGIPVGMAMNVAHVDNFERDYFINHYVISNLTTLNDPLVSQSFVFGSQDSGVDAIYDNYAASNSILFVSAVDNGGGVHSPATCYNGIGVAAYGTVYSSVGPTPDNGRCKPDITASSYVTSFSTPQVSGAAALLMQAALRGNGGHDTNSAFDMRTIKALLLNGAVKPSDWTNFSPSPLDYRYGAGKVNVFNSYRQLAGGKCSCIVSDFVAAGDVHLPTDVTDAVSILNGWDFATNNSDFATPRDGVNHYYFNATNGAGSFICTATLVWNKHADATDINNLDLFLYDCANSNLVAWSTSRVDNVEHIFVPKLLPGRYDLQVWKSGSTGGVTTNEIYALAYEFANVPSLSFAKSGSNLILTWPIYPAGFVAEVSTNLAGVGGWSSAALPAPTLVNGSNQISTSMSVIAQFFRLHQP
jgi:hypothetical protein